MNGIPTTFNEGLPSYTVIGGRERNAKTGFSAVILEEQPCANTENSKTIAENRVELYKQLANCGFDFVVSIEITADSAFFCDYDRLSAEFPFIRFVLSQKKLNLGCMINLAAAEINENNFFILKKGFVPEFFSVKSFKTLPAAICVAPCILKKGGKDAFSSVTSPLTPPRKGNAKNKKSRVLKTEQTAEGNKTLFPFGGMGLYNKESFVRLGGFDITINDEYWQLMDFGLRCYAWGEQIPCGGTLKLISKSELQTYKMPIDESYRRFYLKNLSPVFNLDAAHLPLKCFPRFFARSGLPPSSAWDEFLKARKWVSKNTYRWKQDAKSIVENW